MRPSLGTTVRSRVQRRVNGLLCGGLASALLAAGCSVPPPDIACESPADDSGIAIIGDSVFDLAKVDCTHVGRRLEEMTGAAFVDESVSGATLGAVPQAPGGSIVTQYAESVAPTGPRAVVLDGGANDLFWNCPWHERPGCATSIDDLETQLRSLITDMRTDGVHPSASGSAVLAELIHGALVDNGVLP